MRPAHPGTPRRARGRPPRDDEHRSALIAGHLADDLLPGELKVLTDGIFDFAFGVIESWVAAAPGGGPPADATITKEQLIETTTVMVRGGLTALAAQRARPGSG